MEENATLCHVHDGSTILRHSIRVGLKYKQELSVFACKSNGRRLCPRSIVAALSASVGNMDVEGDMLLTDLIILNPHINFMGAGEGSSTCTR